MAFRKPHALMVAAIIALSAPMAHAGKDTVPSSPSVFSPAAAISISSVFSEVRAALVTGGVTATVGGDGATTLSLASGTTITISADGGTITLRPAGGGAPITLTSSFVATFISAYL